MGDQKGKSLIARMAYHMTDTPAKVRAVIGSAGVAGIVGLCFVMQDCSVAAPIRHQIDKTAQFYAEVAVDSLKDRVRESTHYMDGSLGSDDFEYVRLSPLDAGKGLQQFTYSLKSGANILESSSAPFNQPVLRWGVIDQGEASDGRCIYDVLLECPAQGWDRNRPLQNQIAFVIKDIGNANSTGQADAANLVYIADPSGLEKQVTNWKGPYRNSI